MGHIDQNAQVFAGGDDGFAKRAQATIGYQQCRGARWNMGGDMQKKPPYFDKAQEYKINEETTLELPKMLPPEYDKLVEENGIEETIRPVSAPCFSDFDARRRWKGIAVR